MKKLSKLLLLLSLILILNSFTNITISANHLSTNISTSDNTVYDKDTHSARCENGIKIYILKTETDSNNTGTTNFYDVFGLQITLAVIIISFYILLRILISFFHHFFI